MLLSILLVKLWSIPCVIMLLSAVGLLSSGASLLHYIVVKSNCV